MKKTRPLVLLLALIITLASCENIVITDYEEGKSENFEIDYESETNPLEDIEKSEESINSEGISDIPNEENKEIKEEISNEDTKAPEEKEFAEQNTEEKNDLAIDENEELAETETENTEEIVDINGELKIENIKKENFLLPIGRFLEEYKHTDFSTTNTDILPIPEGVEIPFVETVNDFIVGYGGPYETFVASIEIKSTNMYLHVFLNEYDNHYEVFGTKFSELSGKEDYQNISVWK